MTAMSSATAANFHGRTGRLYSGTRPSLCKIRMGTLPGYKRHLCCEEKHRTGSGAHERYFPCYTAIWDSYQFPDPKYQSLASLNTET